MKLEQQLLTLEKQFWTGGAEFYRAHLDDRCLVAFTEMAGVMSNEQVDEQVAATVKGDRRWRDIDIERKGFLQPEPDIAMLTYHVRGTRADDRPYRALVSSAYVKRNGDWKMTFHQQTPMEV
jgi:hypothetical protein